MSNQQQLYSVMIINRAGGLIYSKLCVPHTLNTNDLLRIASTFHGINAIAQYSIHPTFPQKPIQPPATQDITVAIPPNNGITTIEYGGVRLQCMCTPTGIKFVCTASIQMTPGTCERYLQSLYTLYSDYVLKNSFYDLDNPIRVDKFDTVVQQLVST